VRARHDSRSAGLAGTIEGRQYAERCDRGATMMGESNPRINDNPTALAPASSGSLLEKPVYDPTAPSAIEVEHIVKRYGDFTAVDDVCFSVKEGEIFGLLGPNGAGKSTLIRMMTTLIPITAGKARIGGHDV